MTFGEFKKLTQGIYKYEIWYDNHAYVGVAVEHPSFKNKTITNFSFNADDNGRITCEVDLKD